MAKGGEHKKRKNRKKTVLVPWCWADGAWYFRGTNLVTRQYAGLGDDIQVTEYTIRD